MKHLPPPRPPAARRGLLLLALAASLGAPAVAADESMAARADPWVPPAQRQASAERPPAGAELEAQVQARLKRRFDAADTRRSGLLTRDEARRAGLGFVVRDFEQIDSARRGSVSFDDVQRHLSRRAAAR